MKHISDMRYFKNVLYFISYTINVYCVQYEYQTHKLYNFLPGHQIDLVLLFILL